MSGPFSQMGKCPAPPMIGWEHCNPKRIRRGIRLKLRAEYEDAGRSLRSAVEQLKAAAAEEARVQALRAVRVLTAVRLNLSKRLQRFTSRGG